MTPAVVRTKNHPMLPFSTHCQVSAGSPLQFSLGMHSIVSAQLGAHSKMGRGGTVMVSTINEVDTMDERSLELFEA
jgi:hypothetical protein